jgi:hypothetical protein
MMAFAEVDTDRHRRKTTGKGKLVVPAAREVKKLARYTFHSAMINRSIARIQTRITCQSRKLRAP